MTDVRCPGCGKKLGDQVVGYYRTACPRCHREVVVVRQGTATVTDRDGRSVEIGVAMTTR